MLRPDPERLVPVLVLGLRGVRAHERVDERDAHLLGRGDDLPEVADDHRAMGRIGMERVRVVAEPGDGQALGRDLVDDLAGLAGRQVGHVDVARAGVAPGRAGRPRPARDLEALEAVGGRPVGDLHQRRLRERGGQQAELHRRRLHGIGRPTRAGARSTSTQRPRRALSAIASPTSISSWPSANVA